MTSKGEDGIRRVKLRDQEIGSFPSTGDLRKDATIARDMMVAHGWKPHTQAQAMHLQAFSFAQATALIHDEMLQKQARGEGAAPFVVNAAFALEVYLKSIISALDQAIPPHHDLGRLLADLPEQGKIAIRMQIPRFFNGEAEAESYDLGAILQTLSSAFVAWRYYYEGSGKAQPVNVPRVIYALNVIHGASRRLVFRVD